MLKAKPASDTGTENYGSYKLKDSRVAQIKYLR